MMVFSIFNIKRQITIQAGLYEAGCSGRTEKSFLNTDRFQTHY